MDTNGVVGAMIIDSDGLCMAGKYLSKIIIKTNMHFKKIEPNNKVLSSFMHMYTNTNKKPVSVN